MNKKQKSLIAVYAIAFVIYNVLFYAIPLPKTAASWVEYAFSLIAIIVSFLITAYAFSKGDDSILSKMYGFPMFKVGFVYVIAQIIFAVLISIIGAFIEVPVWIAVVVSIVLLGFALVGAIATDNTRDIIEEQEAVVEKQTKAVTYFKLNVESVLDLCEDAELKKKVVKLSENIRYSDPVSNEELVDIEKKIADEIEILKELVGSNVEEATKKVSYIENLLADRNRRCKATKK